MLEMPLFFNALNALFSVFLYFQTLLESCECPYLCSRESELMCIVLCIIKLMPVVVEDLR